MALHRALAESTGLTIYFADPHSPWQRGIMENTNGLLREYLPKGASLAHYSQRELDRIAWPAQEPWLSHAGGSVLCALPQRTP